MIRLKSDIEELGRLTRRAGFAYAPWQVDDVLREQIDGPLLADVLTWIAGPGGRKALVIGASWPRAVTAMARAGFFVTVVDEDLERIRRVQAAALAEGLTDRVTPTLADYKDRFFEPSAFNVTCVWDAFDAYDDPGPLIRKLTREVKVGGQLFFRGGLVPAQPATGLLARLSSIEPQARTLARRLVVRLRPTLTEALRRPGLFGSPPESVEGAVAALMLVKEVRKEHALLLDAADVVALVPALVRTLPAIRRADARLLVREPGLARTIAVFGSKEKQLGKLAPGMRS